MQNIEKLLKEIEDLKKEVNKYKYDSLTTLRLRVDFEERMNEIFNSKKKYAICLVDLIGLHNINASEGYLEGDRKLIELSNQLKEEFTNSDIFRIGGDEFCIITEMGDIKEFIKFRDSIPQLSNARYVVRYKNIRGDKKSFFKKLDSELNSIKNSEARIAI